MKKMLFVMNPCAGQRRAEAHLARILELFNRADYEPIVHLTAGPGDCEKTVMRHAEAVELIVCCGGDGTFNETLSGVLRSGAKTPIGYIPAGSTNDFAASLKLSTDLLKATRDIIEGQPEWYDVGSFGGRYFAYVASFGAFTRASYATPQSLKNALGHTAYVLGGISELSQLKTEHARFEFSDGTVVEDDFLFGAISNSTSVGGILTLASDKVDMRDGKLELLLVRAPRDLAELTDCIVAVTNQTYNCAMMTFCSAEEIRITVDAEMPWTLDGEFQSGLPQVEVSCVHHAVQIVKRGNELC